MKNPNGYGTVYRLGRRNLRNPWVVIRTVAWTEDGKRIRKRVGSYPSRALAMQELARYNNEPYDLTHAHATFSDLYSLYMDREMGKSLRKNNKVAYNLLAEFHSRQWTSIQMKEWERAVNALPVSYGVKGRCKSLLKGIYTMTSEMGLTNMKNWGFSVIGAKGAQKSARSVFTFEEIKRLWDHSDDPIVAMILIMIYSGVRCSELLNLRDTELFLDEQWFYIKESKTEAGKRVVPIADVVLPLWRRLVVKDGYVFRGPSGYPWTYANYAKATRAKMDSLDIHRNLHETRHTCISLLITAGVHASIVKKIVGHRYNESLTETVYTHLATQVLVDEINKIHPVVEKYSTVASSCQ